MRVVGFSWLKTVRVQRKYVVIMVKGNTGGLRILIPSFSHEYRKKSVYVCG